MRRFLVGISGYSRTGKDTIAHSLVEKFGAIHLGMTDHAKRHMADAYGFSEEQLFGTSEARDVGDLRCPKSVYLSNRCFPLKKVLLEKVIKEGVLLNLNKTYHVCEGREYPAGMLKDVAGLPYQLIESGIIRYFIEEGNPSFWLSPREALQQYCELLEKLYLNSLINYAIRIHLRLIPTADPEFPGIYYSTFDYNRMEGLVKNSIPKRHDGLFMTCFSDFRRRHQIQRARYCAGNKLTPVMIRVKRPGIEKPPFEHISETEQTEIPDSIFDFIINNDGSIDDLNVKVDKIVEVFTMDGWKYLTSY